MTPRQLVILRAYGGWALADILIDPDHGIAHARQSRFGCTSFRVEGEEFCMETTARGIELYRWDDDGARQNYDVLPWSQVARFARALPAHIVVDLRARRQELTRSTTSRPAHPVTASGDERERWERAGTGRGWPGGGPLRPGLTPRWMPRCWPAPTRSQPCSTSAPHSAKPGRAGPVNLTHASARTGCCDLGQGAARPDAWRYLMESVTDGQGDLRQTNAITRYYTEAGTPPGRWLGSGLAGLANGAGLQAGSIVTGKQMDLLYGQGRDPVTGAKLGRGFRHPPSYADRVAARIRALPSRLSPQEKAEAVKRIRNEEKTRRMRRPVVGFDYVFNPPKSVSALWAIADHRIREQITAAHHDAVTDILHLLERDVARTRIGTDGVAQVPVRGTVAAAFDHYDTRANDPQLHTHLVVANRVQAEDGFSAVNTPTITLHGRLC